MEIEGEDAKDIAKRHWPEVVEVGPLPQRGRTRICGGGTYEHINNARLQDRLDLYGNPGALGAFAAGLPFAQTRGGGGGGGSDANDALLRETDDWNVCSHCIVSYAHLIEGWAQLIGVLVACDGLLLALCHAEQRGGGSGDDKLCVVAAIDRLLGEVLQRIASMPTMEPRSCALLASTADALTRRLFELVLFGPALSLSDTSGQVRSVLGWVYHSRGERTALHTGAVATARLVDARDAGGHGFRSKERPNAGSLLILFACCSLFAPLFFCCSHSFFNTLPKSVSAESIDWKKALRSVVDALLGVNEATLGAQVRSSFLLFAPILHFFCLLIYSLFIHLCRSRSSRRGARRCGARCTPRSSTCCA